MARTNCPTVHLVANHCTVVKCYHGVHAAGTHSRPARKCCTLFFPVLDGNHVLSSELTQFAKRKHLEQRKCKNGRHNS